MNSLFIPAPFSSDDDDNGSGSEPEPAPEVPKRAPSPSPSFSSEVFDDVDGDGFRVGVPGVDEGTGSNPNPSLDRGGSSEEEAFDEVDGDGFSVTARVSSVAAVESEVGTEKDDNFGAGLRELGSTDEELEGLKTETERDGVDEDLNATGSVKGRVFGGAQSPIAEENLMKDETFGERLNLIDGEGEFVFVDSADGIDKDNEGIDALYKKDENLGGDFRESSSIVEELEDLKPQSSNAEEKRVKDEVLSESLKLTKRFSKDGEDEFKLGASMDGIDKKDANVDVLDEKNENLGGELSDLSSTVEELEDLEPQSSNAEAKHLEDKFLGERLNLTGNLSKDGEDKFEVGDSVDGNDKENENIDVLDEKDENLGSETGEDDEDSSRVKEKYENLGGGLRESSSIVEEFEDLKPAYVVSIVDEAQSPSAEENHVKDEVLGKSLNSTEGFSKDREDEFKLRHSMDGTDEENEKVDILDEKHEILLPHPANINSADTREVALEPTEGKYTMIVEDDEPKELEFDSNQNDELDDDDGSVAVDSDKSESSSSKLDSEDWSKENEGVNGGFSSPVNSNIAENSDTMNGTQTSLVEDERTVAKSEAKPTNAENGSFFHEKGAKEEENFRDKVELIRIKFLRLVHRLGHSPKENVVTSVLYHLACTEDTKHWMFKYEIAKEKAIKFERDEKDKLDFSCNVLVIGKTGVGKSATINSIFNEEKSHTNPFKPETSSVRKIEGLVDGIKIQVLDTPGLKSSILDQASNRKILSSMKKHMKKCSPDVVLYIDRLDTPTRGFNDLPLLKSITSTFGASIWSKAIVVLTHASSTPPEGVSYEESIDQRSHIVQDLIWNAVGDIRLKNPVILVENHPSYRRYMEVQRTKLLLLCYSSKILSEAKSLHKVQGSSVQKFLNFFLSLLHESKPHAKLSSDISGIDNSDVYSNDFLDQEDEYSKHKQKKQSKKQIKRLEEIKKGQENSQDLALPPPFDRDDPVCLHRSLEPSSNHHTGFLLDTGGYDHYYGFDGVSLKIPGAIYVKLKKDKKDLRINLESSVLTRHKKNGSLLATFNTQIIDNQMACGGNVEVKLSKMAVRVGMNNQRRGQIKVRTRSWEPLEIVIMGLVLIDMYIFRRKWPGECSSS